MMIDDDDDDDEKSYPSSTQSDINMKWLHQLTEIYVNKPTWKVA